MTDKPKDSPDNTLPLEPGAMPSINEPPGSDVTPEPGEPETPPEEPPPEAAYGRTDDPDELEDEIDQAEEDGDVSVHHKSKKGKKR